MPSLTALDVSKNKFATESVHVLLRAMSDSIEVLIMSSVQGLNDENAISMIDMIR